MHIKIITIPWYVDWIVHRMVHWTWWLIVSIVIICLGWIHKQAHTHTCTHTHTYQHTHTHTLHVDLLRLNTHTHSHTSCRSVWAEFTNTHTHTHTHTHVHTHTITLHVRSTNSPHNTHLSTEFFSILNVENIEKWVPYLQWFRFALVKLPQPHNQGCVRDTFTLSPKEKMLGLLQICKKYPKHVFAYQITQTRQIYNPKKVFWYYTKKGIRFWGQLDSKMKRKCRKTHRYACEHTHTHTHSDPASMFSTKYQSDPLTTQI